MAFMVHHLRIDDFDDWKSLFDADPVGRKQVAKGHLMLRGLDDPNEVFTRVEFDSVEEAKAFRDRLLASGALDTTTVPDAADGRAVGREHHVLAASRLHARGRARPGASSAGLRLSQVR